MVTKLVVANRGEIASRVFRTCAALGIRTVAVYSDADRDLPFVSDADEAVRLVGSTPAETYLRGDLVLEAAARVGADAVHPGYGFLSESANFARQVLDAGLVWIGPSPSSIEAMGLKVEAKRRVAAAGVPVLPGQEVAGGSPDALLAGAAGIGYPLLVKASAGGGGRGMRIVRRADDLIDAVASAQSEATSAFGDGTVFVERYVEAPRHVEVQVFGDTHGSVVALFERECSIQRRHQKVIEECPSPAVDASLRAEMSEAAVAAARAVDYVGAGTVEFVLAPDGSFAFLEMNTRLQVEHAVTEAVTGLDLVALQLAVAEGHPLPPEAHHPALHGHAIEVRLYAEDPARDYLPGSGTLHAFDLGGAGVRVDRGVEAGSVLSTYYDAMLAKVVTHAPTRDLAARRLASTLERARICGVTTNRDLLVRTLRDPDFLAGRTDTGFLERHDPAVLGAPSTTGADRRLHALAATAAVVTRRRAEAAALATLPAGWRNNPSQAHTLAWLDAGAPPGRADAVAVSWWTGRDGGWYDVVVGDAAFDSVSVVARPGDQRGSVLPDLSVDLTADGVRRRFTVALEGDVAGFDDATGPLAAYVDSGTGHSAWTACSRFPSSVAGAASGSLVAPMPGTVVRVPATVGQEVATGEPLVVLEAMKMEHTVSSPGHGTVVEIHVEVGRQVDTGMILVVLAAPDAPAAADAEDEGAA